MSDTSRKLSIWRGLRTRMKNGLSFAVIMVVLAALIIASDPIHEAVAYGNMPDMWTLLALFILLVMGIVFIVDFHVASKRSNPTEGAADGAVAIDFDEERIECPGPDGKMQRIAWSELGAVRIQTTAGPFAEDVLWILMPSNDKRAGGVVIPNGAQEMPALIAAMQSRLAGFDNLAVAEAMSSTENATLQVWPAAESNDATQRL